MRKAVPIDNGVATIRHLVDHVDLGDDGLPPSALHKGPNVTDRQTNQEVHDNDGEQSDIGSEEKVGASCKIPLKELRKRIISDLK